MTIYLGCPIWAFKGWVGSFYPPGAKPADFLRLYARRLTTVEGNTTFYAVPSPETVRQWAEDMPESFRFCPKLPRTVSHTGKLAEQIGQARQFVETLAPMRARLGPLFLQLPPRYAPNMLPDLRAFLSAWDPKIRLAVEVRHLGWFSPPHDSALNAALSERSMARVVIDTRPIRSLQGDKLLEGSVYQLLLAARLRKPDVPVFPQRTADFTFLRYIGHPDPAVNQPFIAAWADHLAGMLKPDDDAFIFCHCPDETFSPSICREFHQELSTRIDLPHLPWDEIENDQLTQGCLF
jgi:uncharacterized protein YecE (DUF72 family)